jgi:protein-S-isoprenylcysteine O-methyltransferase Ste14
MRSPDTTASWFPKPYADTVARLRVPGGFVLVAAFLYFSDPTPASLLWGLPVSVLGLWVRGWAAGHLEKNQQLAIGGPYAYLRNPLYIGTLLVAAGLVIASRQPGLALLFAAVFGLIYLPVIGLEEQHLRNLFPQYAEYTRHVRALLPRLTPYRPAGSSSHHFRWSLYWKNQEHNALLGFAAGTAVLLWKALAP